ncbi:MAG: Nif3-like dinuclear metal center hexameric protein [Dissulfurimicrobium sp.]|uniref:Nif3-like dinuclear metal center hexameric protein n=1 Tax=Dissulfurimicrobium sp. TaxID=2022436 RepID=UPI0040496E50
MKLSPSASEIWQALLEWAPAELAESWDNIGIQVGDPYVRVKRVMVALDPTCALLEEAKRKGAQMVITHHPLLFKPIRSIDLSMQIPRLLAGYLHSDIALFAAHTNLDAANGGVSDIVANALGLFDIRPLTSSQMQGAFASGIGRIGRLGKQKALSDIANDLLSLIAAPGCLMVGNPGLMIEKVALCCGSGSDLWPFVINSGAELFISAEIKHHIARDAEERGIAIIDAGHFYTEHLIVFEVARFLRQKADQMKWDVELFVFNDETSPFTYWS